MLTKNVLVTVSLSADSSRWVSSISIQIFLKALMTLQNSISTRF